MSLGDCTKMNKNAEDKLFIIDNLHTPRPHPIIMGGGCASWAPRRVCFFFWSVAWGNILTCDNLMRWGYSMTSWCCMCRCRCNGETVDHLMLHCPLAVVLWNFFFWVFDVHWVVSGCVMDMLFGWRNWFGKHYLEVWNLVPLCLMWTIWGEQNQRIFEDKANS